MRYHVLHLTEYEYEGTATLSQQLLHMTPRDFNYQHCLSQHIRISPSPSESADHTDYFGNHAHYFAIFTPHKVLQVTTDFSVELSLRPTMQSLQYCMPWKAVRDTLAQHGSQHLDATAFLYASPKVPCTDELENYALQSFTPGKPILLAAMELTQRIYNEFEFDADATEVSTPLSEVLQGRRGVCQDFAHLMIACLRSLGLACRYVSGYILTASREGHDKLIGADASHAWVSVYCPTYGWIDFDPTNNCLVQDKHVTVAWGRDFSDISPMHGVVLGGGAQTLNVSVTVTPIQTSELALQLTF